MHRIQSSLSSIRVRNTVVETSPNKDELLDEALASMASGNHQKALKQIQYLAECGHAKSSFELGKIYQHALCGADKNSTIAYTLFKRAAMGGDQRAWLPLAFMYKNGDGIPENQAFAFSCFCQCPADPVAQYNLGLMRKAGSGCMKDLALAERHFKQAADLGSQESKLELDKLLAEGLVKDCQEKSAVQGDEGSQVYLANLRSAIKPSQESQQTVDNASPTKAEINSSESEERRKLDYVRALTLLKQRARAVEILEPMVKDHDAKSHYNFGKIYYQGLESIKPDYTKAHSYLTRAAQGGESQAWFLLGVLYMDGRGAPKDYHQAAQCFSKCPQTNSTAQYNLGVIFKQKNYQGHDYKKAAEHFRHAADHGNAQTKYESAMRLFEIGETITAVTILEQMATSNDLTVEEREFAKSKLKELEPQNSNPVLQFYQRLTAQKPLPKPTLNRGFNLAELDTDKF